MRKVVFLTGGMGRGGAERVISILANHYSAKGWDVIIGMLLHSSVEYDLDSRIRICDLSPTIGLGISKISVLIKLRKLIKHEKPDVIVAFMAQICILAGLALIGIPVRLIMSERIDPASVQRSWIRKKLVSWSYLKARKVIFQTQRAQDYFATEIQKNSCIITNPIKVYCYCSANTCPEIVTAGRLTEQKNHKMLISAFKTIHQKHPEYKLTIYGEGEARNQLEAQINESNLNACVQLPGNVKNIHEAISNARIFVLSSDYEGLSNALIEAMMMGFPVISTNCAGSDEIIQDGKNGLLIPIGDESALVDRMEKLISDSSLRQELGKNAKESVEKCKIENVISEWESVIEDVN